jgi:hypothetical protein
MYISRNPSIFEKVINYKYLNERMDVIREELMMKSMRPRPVRKVDRIRRRCR